jgi:23S rRNA (uridine2552-2'-O)-methyltransferase
VSGKRGARRWLKGHLADTYVKQANALGYRSRAAFKLVQLDAAQRLLRPGTRVVDLGAAPGGWSQVAAQRVAPGGQVLAVDLIDMAPLNGVEFVCGDFTDPAVRAALRERLPVDGVDLVLSDMAPNLSGVKENDQARAAELVVAALDFASEVLTRDGAVLVKLFHGAEMPDLLAQARQRFGSVKLSKPPASRARSAEVDLLGRGRNGVF